MIQMILFFVMAVAAAVIFIMLLVNSLLILIRKTNEEKIARSKRKAKRNLLSMAALLCTMAVLGGATAMFARTPNIEGGISELVKVKLNGRNEWISIRGEDENAPIILFLAGGPGGTQMAAVRENLGELEKDFVIVNWDQPGSGKSYGAISGRKITLEVYIEDGIALTEYLMERFGKEKIYLIGESWGSALAVFLADAKPEYYAGIIGTGQMVDFVETEIYDYNKALEIAEAKNDADKIAKLRVNGMPPYYGKGVTMKSAEYLNYLSAYMAHSPEVLNGGFDTIGDVKSPEYSILDKINFFRGIINTFDNVYPQLYEIDLRESYSKLEVPIYFFIGRHDINAPVELAYEYYELLNATVKEFVWFENSAHSPWINEKAKFIEQTREVFN